MSRVYRTPKEVKIIIEFIFLLYLYRKLQFILYNKLTLLIKLFFNFYFSCFSITL